MRNQWANQISMRTNEIPFANLYKYVKPAQVKSGLWSSSLSNRTTIDV